VTTLARKYRKTALCAAVIMCAGCASKPSGEITGDVPNAARYSGTTLADLESTDITVETQSLDNASAEGALESYRRAVELFQDPEKRSKSLRRMADLALAAAEDEGARKAEAAMSTAEEPQVSDAELDQNIDKMLYENFMREAQETENREEKYALLDLAGSMVNDLEGAELETDYNTAILLYKTLLDTSENPQERAEAYYLLAKAYDLAGKWDESRATLDALVKEYPDSQYYTEAQFRRGEMLFSEGDFEYSALAYKEVIRTGGESDFYEQAVYKLGWSEYKLGYYEKALAQFFTLIDHLHGMPELEDEKTMQAKLMHDTQRATSLAFSQLDGAETVREWFAKNGHRDYEADVYRSLGDVYLQQERFRDAAVSFDTFVNVYPESPLAPEFSSRNIQAYEKGGFPTLVLPAKEKFVERYGVHSAFWARYPDARDAYVNLLKGHILDLAKHNHALAQKAGKPDAYLAPVRWYKEFLDTPPPGDENAEVNHLYAQALFSAQQFEQAVAQFEKTAYGYEGYADAPEAAYFALVAYQAHMKTLPADSEEQQAALASWRDRKINSSLKFAATYPAHEKVPSVLYNIIEDQLAQKDVAAAVKTAGVLVNRKPPPEEKLLVYGWQTIANGEFDMGRYKVAEFGYSKLLQYPSLTAEQRSSFSERLAASVYRQAEALQEREELAAAAAMFLRVGQVYPQAEVRKNADFDAATLYLKLEQYDKAIPVLEAFRKRYPDDPLNETIPDKLAVAYENTGNFSAAALELEAIAANYAGEDEELARQALWQAAEMQDRAKQPAGSIRLYKKYVNTYPQPYDFRAEAQYRLTNLYDETGNRENRRFWLDKIIDTYREAGGEASDRVAWLAAWASFDLAEAKYAEFESIKLTQPLKASLGRKTNAMKEALERYESIAAIGVSEYATAANYKIGQMYRVLARDMMDSERPNGLSGLEMEQYDLLLEEQALPYEDQAIDLLIANTDLVGEGIYDKWVKQSFSELAKLLPGRYAKVEQVETYVDIIY
jgi:tetratricopeptide (TPR) repeat protein